MCIYTDNVKNGAWMSYARKGASASTNYFGTHMVVAYDKNDKYIKTSATEYDDGNNCGSDACDVCAERGEIAMIFLILSFILIFPILVISLLRMQPDLGNLNKFIVCNSLLFSMLFIIISMSVFAKCHDEILDYNNNLYGKNGGDLAYGPGFVCLSLNLLTCFIMFMFHVLLKSS